MKIDTKKLIDADRDFGSSDCSTAIQALRILRNGLEKDAKTAKERAEHMTGYIRSQWLVKASTLVEVIDLVDTMVSTIKDQSKCTQD